MKELTIARAIDKLINGKSNTQMSNREKMIITIAIIENNQLFSNSISHNKYTSRRIFVIVTFNQMSFMNSIFHCSKTV